MIVVIGDSIFDEHTFLKTLRPSREVNKDGKIVPVTKRIQTIGTFGGCGVPAQWLRKWGSEVSVMTCISGSAAAERDDAADAIYELAEEQKIGLYGYCGNGDGVIVKNRTYIDDVLQYRTDREVFTTEVNMERILYILQHIHRRTPVTGILFSDYGYGMVTKEIIQRVIEWKNSVNRKIPIVADPRSCDFHDYEGVDVITPNLEEFRAACPWYCGHDSKNAEQETLMDMRTARYVLLTRGKDGMTLYDTLQSGRTGVPWEAESEVQSGSVVDTVGAGDACVAAVLWGLVNGVGITQAAQNANHASGVAIRTLSATRFPYTKR